MTKRFDIFDCITTVQDGIFNIKHQVQIKDSVENIAPKDLLKNINLEPRVYQQLFYDSWKSRNILLWSRGAGKDIACFALMAAEAIKHRGKYLYIFPHAEQGRGALWNGITDQLISLTALFPSHWVKKIDDRAMIIELINGSVIQIAGCAARKGNNLRGAGAKGIVFSEYAWLPSGDIWTAIEPLLSRVPNSWVIFNSTPYGLNHYNKLYVRAKAEDKTWKVSEVTCEEYMSPEQIEYSKQSCSSESGFLREYMCSWDAPTEESVYGMHLKDLPMQEMLFNPSMPVFTVWDLGRVDLTSIWFYQVYNANGKNHVHIIDFYEAANEDMYHFVDVLRSTSPHRDYPYHYNANFMPFDARLDLQIGLTREQVLLNSGIGTVVVLNRVYRVENGINQVRTFLKDGKANGTLKFEDNTSVRKGIEHLKNYAYTGTEFGVVRHDIHSHAADAFRYLVDSINIVCNYS